MRTNAQRRLLLLTFVGLALLVLNQNCGEGFAIKQVGSGYGTISFFSTSVSGRIESWDAAYGAPIEVTQGDCYDSTLYNLCLAGRDPVTANGSPFTMPLTNLNSSDAVERKVFRYGLKVPTTAPSNESYILAPAANDGVTSVAPKSDKTFKYRLSAGTNHDLGQINLWYWLNRQRTYMYERSKKFFYDRATTGVQVKLRPYISSLQNASFSRVDASINFGYLQNGTNKMEFALDAPVLAHEVGHGNFFFANRGGGTDPYTNCSESRQTCFCPDKNGCMGGIDEGIGDIHAFILFQGDAAIGRYATNSMTGLRNAATDIAGTLTAQTLFDQKATTVDPGGEIHNMGQVYAAIWYGVWKEAKTLGYEADVELLFTEHLVDLRGSDNFISAYSGSIKPNTEQLFSKTRATTLKGLFGKYYSKMGLTL